MSSPRVFVLSASEIISDTLNSPQQGIPLCKTVCILKEIDFSVYRFYFGRVKQYYALKNAVVWDAALCTSCVMYFFRFIFGI
jgi:hypothetical protein